MVRSVLDTRSSNARKLVPVRLLALTESSSQVGATGSRRPEDARPSAALSRPPVVCSSRMRVLFASRYVDPEPRGSNSNVYRQAVTLNKHLAGVEVEVLAWPMNDDWHGLVPSGTCQHPPIRSVRGGLTYHVFTAPMRWNVNQSVPDNGSWEAAVDYGCSVLNHLRPDILHLQHRHGLWWILESAQRLGMPTVYSNHDWGLACMRTTLVMGSGHLCDGEVVPSKCADCVTSGRGKRGRLNEAIVNHIVGQYVMMTLARSPIADAMARRGIVTESTSARATNNYTRASRVISRLSHCFTPSRFGMDFFARLGCPRERISVLPWYHTGATRRAPLPRRTPFTISYVGRLSHEKGLHVVFAALERLRATESLTLRIAGEVNSAYGRDLMTRYPDKLGTHRVQWLGWVRPDAVYHDTDLVIIPSVWMDNTPLVLIEALANEVPVIATRIPPIEELVVDGESGFLADFGSVESLAQAIARALAHKAAIRSGTVAFPAQRSLDQYVSEVQRVYASVLGQ